MVKLIITLGILSIFLTEVSVANEVFNSRTLPEVTERIHPSSGKPFGVIRSTGDEGWSPELREDIKNYSRPDYEYLQSKTDKKIMYDGPSSNRKKIYYFAGTVATLGVVGGSLGMLAAASAPVGTGTAASGAGAYLAGSAALSTGTVAASWAASRPDPHQDDFTHDSQVKVISDQTRKQKTESENSI